MWGTRPDNTMVSASPFRILRYGHSLCQEEQVIHTQTEKPPTVGDGILFLKVCVGILPALIVYWIAMPHHRVAFSVALVLGALLQYSIPPRRRLVPLLIGASILALLCYYAGRWQ